MNNLNNSNRQGTDESNADSSTDYDSTIKTDLVTDLTHILYMQEINLLSKGPKFSLSSGVNERNMSFYRLANQIRWKSVRESNPQSSEFVTYPQSWHIYRSESKDELENKLQRIHHKLQAILKTL